MVKGNVLLTLVITVVAATGVLAAELDVELGAGIFSKYIWRGQNLGNRPVIQPSATIGKDGWSLNVWGNMPVNDKDPAGRAWNFNEVDYTVDYSGTYDMVNYSAGFILYSFPRPVGNQPGSPEAHEIYGTIGIDTLLSPSVTVYRGTKASDGWYVNAGVSYNAVVTEDISVDLGANLGWADENYNQDYWGLKTNALNDFVLSASVPLNVAGVEIVPSVSYVTIPTSRIRGSNGFSASSDFWVAGVSAVFAF